VIPVPTKIRAVIEDPASPILNCYDATNIESLAALSVSKILANQPITTKENTTMSYSNYTGVTGLDGPAAKTKRYVQGIGPMDHPEALVGALHRLGLLPNDLTAPLKTLAAAGRPLSPYFQVSMTDLDIALNSVANVDAAARIGFKSSLNRAGLLKK
jgi:hypothetical protein